MASKPFPCPACNAAVRICEPGNGTKTRYGKPVEKYIFFILWCHSNFHHYIHPGGLRPGKSVFKPQKLYWGQRSQWRNVSLPRKAKPGASFLRNVYHHSLKFSIHTLCLEDVSRWESQEPLLSEGNELCLLFSLSACEMINSLPPCASSFSFEKSLARLWKPGLHHPLAKCAFVCVHVIFHRVKGTKYLASYSRRFAPWESLELHCAKHPAK